MNLNESAAEAFAKLRQTSPLVHNITNYVVMNFSANVMLAAGAAPVMAHAHNEVEDMVAIAGSLAINIGTLTDYWVESMLLAGKKANRLNIPVILDPVGAGATPLRTQVSHRLMDEINCAVVRGNASEIMSVYGANAETKGVDSANTVEEAWDMARELALKAKTVIAVTGAKDIVTDGRRLLTIANGDPLMGRITGMGCSATSIIGAFLAVEPDPLLATAYGLALMGVAGEIAKPDSNGPGTFISNFLDALYNLTPEALAAKAQIEEI